MPTPPPAATAVLLAVVALVPQLGAGIAEAAPPTCQGRPVTVEGAIGTEGDDVMLAPLNAWEGVEGRGGNDTICLVDGPDRGSRDPMFFADAGPGDDSVSFEGTYYASVVLGAGADRFTGNDTGTTVYTGAYDSSLQTNRYFGQADTETDVVTTGGGRDTVYTGDTAGFSANPDRVATGGSSVDTDTVFYAGRMTPEGELDNGESRDLLFLVDTWGPGELAIDNVAGRAEVSGTEVLRWTGVGSFVIEESPRHSASSATPGQTRSRSATRSCRPRPRRWTSTSPRVGAGTGSRWRVSSRAASPSAAVATTWTSVGAAECTCGWTHGSGASGPGNARGRPCPGSTASTCAGATSSRSGHPGPTRSRSSGGWPA